MDYKRIIRSQTLRFRILKALSWVPDNWMIRLQYRIKTGRWPNLKHPQRFTEKLQVYKMKYRNPIIQQCVDKFEVRKYVESKGLGGMLNELYGIYNKPSDIDFSKLPNQFVIKSTSGGRGLNIILVKDKALCRIDEIKKTCIKWLSYDVDQSSAGREWAYSGIKKTRIIVERLLTDKKNKDGSIEDFKFFCFNGEFKALCVDKDRYSNHIRGFWDENLQYLDDVKSDHENIKNGYQLPQNIKEMISVAEKLSDGFPFVRVDLYNIEGKVYFGELTFYPWSGYVNFYPDSFDFKLGSYFTAYN